MTAAMEVALGARHVMLVGLLRIAFPGYTLRLADASAVVTAMGEQFVGRDARFGTIGAIESVGEATGDQMPGLDLVLMPPALSAAVDLAQPTMQGAAVRAWLAAIDIESGQTFAEPELLFAGEVDTVALEIDRGTRTLAVSCASVFERLMEPDEGGRLADSFHQWVWPGELGFANMSGTPVDRLWGPGSRAPSVTLAPQLPRTGVQRFF
jgi:hypothetical protein